MAKIDRDLAKYLADGFIRNAKSLIPEVPENDAFYRAISEYTLPPQSKFFSKCYSNPIGFDSEDDLGKNMQHTLRLEGLFSNRIAADQTQGRLSKLMNWFMDGNIEHKVKGDEYLLQLMSKSDSPYSAAGSLTTFTPHDDSPQLKTKYPILFFDRENAGYVRYWQSENEFLPVMNLIFDKPDR